MTLLRKAGSGSVDPVIFNDVVDAEQNGSGGVVTAADIDSQAASNGDVLTADGAGNALWEASPAPSFATPAVALGAAAAAGVASTVIRSDSTIVAFDSTSPTTQAFGDSAVVGTASVAARRDHKHAMPATPTSVSGNAGTATALQTSRNIDGQGFDGTANITVIAPGTHAATSKTTPADADELPLVDSAASNVLKKLSWANLKATVKAYTDTLYTAIGASAPPNGTAGGDLTGSYPNPTLAAAGGGAAGPLGSATVTPIVTVDAKGRVTALSSATTAPTNSAGGHLTGNYPNPSIASSVVTSAMIVDATIVQGDLAAALVTALSGFSTAWTVVPKTGDESVQSNTTPQDDDELFFTATSGKAYEIELYIVYVSTGGAGTPDIKIDFGEDSTLRGSAVTVGVNSADSSVVSAGNTAQSNQPAYGTAATNRAIQVRAWHVGAGGTFKFQWAQNTSGANATTVKAGSFLRYRLII